MAINPNIALEGHGIDLSQGIAGVGNAYEMAADKKLKRESMRQSTQLHEAQMRNINVQEAQRTAQLARDQQFSDAVSSGAPTQALFAIDHKAAAEYTKAQSDAKASKLQADIYQYTLDEKRLEHLGRAAAASTTGPQFLANIAHLEQNNMISHADSAPYLAEYAKGGWTPEFQQKVQGMATTSMSVAQSMSEKRAEAQLTLNQATEKRLAAESTAKLPGLKAASTLKELEVTGDTPIQPAEKERLKELANNMTMPELLMRAAKGDPDAKAALKLNDQSVAAGRSQINLVQPLPGGKGAEKLTGADYLATLPISMANKVRQVASGDMAAPSLGTRSADGQQLLSALMQYDPTFNSQRAQVRKAFATGPEGANIGSLNTAMVHMDRLSEAVKAMKNGSFTPGNELFNYFKDKYGSASVTDAGMVTDVVVGEMAKAMKGNATDVEIAKLGQKLRASNSPEQWAGIVHHGIELLSDKATTYQERFQQVAPGDTTYDVLLPSARKALNKYGVGGSLSAKPGGTGGGKDLSKHSTDDLFKMLGGK